MSIRAKKHHPALKHAGYSATSILPGEDAAEFEKLRQDLIAELAPSGVLEDKIVADLARPGLAQAESCNVSSCRPCSRPLRANRI